MFRTYRVAIQAVADNMRAASDHLHSLCQARPDEVIDVAVTCDGTWSKRGFTAAYRVTAVIALE